MGRYKHFLSLDTTWYPKNGQSLVHTLLKAPLNLGAYNSKTALLFFLYIYYQISMSVMVEYFDTMIIAASDQELT